MNWRLRLVLILTWIAGAVVFSQAIVSPQLLRPFTSQAGAIAFALLLSLAIVSEMKPMPYTLGRIQKDESLTITLILAAMMAFGWAPAVVLAGASVIVADLAASKPYYKILFNASMYALATRLAAAAFTAIQAELQMLLPLAPALQEALAGVSSGLVYYLINLSMLMLVISLAQGLRFSQAMIWGFRDSALVNLALIAIGIAMAVLWEVHPVLPIMLIPPILVAKTQYQSYTRLRTEADLTLASMADLLDLRDHITGQHSLRVSELSYAVARQLGLPEEEALALKAVARVHDLGKVVVPDSVLLKRGALSPKERTRIQGHVEAGGQILKHLSLYQPHLGILLQHHEHVDGGGYPNSLRADEILLAARILTVCDSYDTITSDRPYRKAAEREEAMAELERHAGSQFDPRVIEALEAHLLQEGKLRKDWRALANATLPGDEAARPIPVPETISGNGRRSPARKRTAGSKRT